MDETYDPSKVINEKDEVEIDPLDAYMAQLEAEVKSSHTIINGITDPATGWRVSFEPSLLDDELIKEDENDEETELSAEKLANMSTEEIMAY